MTHPDSAVPSDALAVDRFLRRLERRALQMAGLALPRQALAEETLAVNAVGAAMRAFATRHEAVPERAWPVLFWSLLDSGLAQRGAASAGAGPAVAGGEDFMALPDAPALTRLVDALRALPPPRRQAFLLRVCEDFDVAASARVLRLPEQEVRTQLFQALRNLRAGLGIRPSVDSDPAAHHDGAWILRCRTLLDGAARALDQSTLARLEQARRTALSGTPPPARETRWLAWAGGLAIVAGVALALSRLLPSLQHPPSPSLRSEPAAQVAPPPPRIAPSQDTPLAAPDFDLLLDAEDETMLEDLAFYSWLAEEQRREGGQ